MTYYDNIFFHVQRLDGQRTEWKTGDVVSIKKENHNEFYSGLLRDAEFLEENVGLIEYSEQFFKSDINRNIQINDSNFKALYHIFEDNSFRYEELAKKLKSSLFHYLKWIREEIFEQVRLSIDSSLPSRRNCIWISRKNDLPKWWSMFKDYEKKIIKLQIDSKGSIHDADGTFIKVETSKISYYQNLATSYWNGVIESKEELEILYEGKLNVLDEYNDISEI